MAYDEKQFLDLLQEYKSDETKKARRNVTFIACVIIAAAVLQIPVNDVQLFGMKVPRHRETEFVLIATALLLYWLVMFLIAWTHDKEIQRERERFLKVEIDRIKARFAYGEGKIKSTGGQRVPDDYAEVKAALQAYDAQRERTRRAWWLGILTNNLELWVPLVLASAALVVLIGALIL